MARIRTVKPEFFDDEKLAQLSEAAQLVYIGLWVFADDEGIVRSSATWLKSKIFPHKPKIKLSKFDGWLTELKILGRLHYFTYNNEGYFIIKNFRNHQRIDKPQASKLPKILIDEIRRTLQEDSKSTPAPNSNSKGIVIVEGEGREATPPPTEPKIDGFREIEILKNLVLADKNYVALVTQKGIPEIKVEGWVDAFNRYLTMLGTTLKQEKDYRQHFPNWLNRVPNYRTINPEEYKPLKDAKPNNNDNRTGYNSGSKQTPRGVIIPDEKDFGTF